MKIDIVIEEDNGNRSSFCIRRKTVYHGANDCWVHSLEENIEDGSCHFLGDFGSAAASFDEILRYVAERSEFHKKKLEWAVGQRIRLIRPMNRENFGETGTIKKLFPERKMPDAGGRTMLVNCDVDWDNPELLIFKTLHHTSRFEAMERACIWFQHDSPFRWFAGCTNTVEPRPFQDGSLYCRHCGGRIQEGHHQ